VNKDNSHGHERPARVLLLLTARTYRAGPFIEAASKLGIEVVKAVDMERALSEYWRYPLGIDYSDTASAVAAILEYCADTPVGAIISVDDSASVLAAEASKKLGLPHNSPAAALAARDKHVMRNKLASANVRAPRSNLYFAPPKDQRNRIAQMAQEITFPCVLKPRNLSGSRGVIRANDPDEFVSAASRLALILRRFNPHEETISFLVEEYIPGIEVALEGILSDGRLHIMALFDKPDPLEGPFFEETIYVTPSRLDSEIQSEIFQCTTSAAEALGLREGPIHAELRVNESGAWIIEIAGRSIGGLCSQTLHFSYEASLEELILRQALGQRIDRFHRQKGSSGVMMIPIPEAGILKRIDGYEEALSVPLIESISFTAQEHSLLTPLPEGDSYLGFIFARGDNPEQVEESLRTAHSKLSFQVAPQLPIL